MAISRKLAQEKNRLFELWSTANTPEIEAAFINSLRKHAYAICWVIFHNRRPDIVNDVVHRVLTRSESFKGTSEFSTWFHSLVVNRCRSVQRKEIPQEQREVPLENVDESEFREDFAGDRRIDMARALQKLTHREQDIVQLKIEGQSEAAIADLLGLNVPQVKHILFSLKRRLNRQMEDNTNAQTTGTRARRGSRTRTPTTQ